jgi:hypothetical protein
MRFVTPTNRRNLNEASAGFTLAEVLAALLFMAIVVPVAMQGMHVAALAGTVGERKGEAVRVAQRILDDAIVMTNWSATTQGGDLREGIRPFRWTLHNEAWSVDLNQNVIRLLTVEVFFNAQDREYSVRLSTLIDSTPPQIISQ